MTALHILQTILELIACSILVYGFMNERKVIKWELKQKIKICKFLIRLIEKYEERKEIE